MTKLTEEEEHAIYLSMRELEDFSCFPLPQTWYKKYGIEQPGLINPREYMESNYALKMQFAKKDLPTITRGPLKDEEGNIRLLPFLDPPKIEVETITRPFRKEGDFNPDILPGLIDFSKEPMGTEAAHLPTSTQAETDTKVALENHTGSPS
jgi:hypothetical protein